jgi:hypothetical protein
MTPHLAETVAIQALGWLAGNDELWPVFLGATGAGAEDAAARASDPAFLASVLEFLTSDDAWIVAFCDHAGLPYDRPLRARYALPGAERVDWT